MNDLSTYLKSKAMNVYRFYADGFRSMTVGKKLWAIILIKLAVIFLVLKVFLFPDVLERDYDNDADRADAVRDNLINITSK